uniref:Zinc knuckle CX2CX4HX4C domain-containing protein n=1 Tax=Manihot esculenta TaxID=3983 RepID=A0A2C9WHD9_MANES
MHVRASINVRQPLKRRMQLSKRENNWFWADFKYKRLPTFCYLCSLLGHSD